MQSKRGAGINLLRSCIRTGFGVGPYVAHNLTFPHVRSRHHYSTCPVGVVMWVQGVALVHVGVWWAHSVLLHRLSLG